MNQYPLPNTNQLGDGFNYRGFTFSAPDPGRLNAFVGKLDLNLTANGNHKLFVRGNLQDDKQTLSVQQFPGEPPNVLESNDSKGIALGYTAILSNNLINNMRYGFVRQGFGDSGAPPRRVRRLRQECD